MSVAQKSTKTESRASQAFSPNKAPLVVLKFGSSVLASPAKIPEAVSEIYRFVRAGRRVIAVTSAYAGVTDRLLAEAQQAGCPHDNINGPAYVALGEETSAAMLALACDRAGLCAIALKTAELGIFAEGPIGTAQPKMLVGDGLQNALAYNDVVVVPGFVGVDSDHRTVLLGRGGSDLTAVFLALTLKAERVRLVKDVDGVYDGDPASKPDAHRFSAISWRHALNVAAPLIQPRALKYAEDAKLRVEVGALGRDNVTIVGPEDGGAHSPRKQRPLRVAIAGCGVVGAGVARRLTGRQDGFEIVSVLVRDMQRARDVMLPAHVFTTDAKVLLEAQPDVLVDLLSDGPLGAHLSEAALRAGIAVVSANKQAVAANYRSLHHIAERQGAGFYYSAAVGGGAPLLETVAAAAKLGDEITDIEGVFNGTVNFLLERLASGQSFEEALTAARAAGLAEEDPSADLDGRDAAAKLTLVALAAFGRAPAPTDLRVTGLTEPYIREAAKTRMKQITRLTWRDHELKGEIVFEPAADTPFVRLRGDRNAIEVKTANGMRFTARGRGAGRWPTTESVFADLVDLRNRTSAAC